MRSSSAFVREEGGFTTPAAALALLVVCSLVFVGARGVAVESRSAQVQYVADAGALAADNVVAEFVTAGQVADATALSLSLLSLTLYAASAVAAFVPGAQGAASEIASLGSKVIQARAKFVETASRGLNAAQEALPAICALRSAQVIQANADASGIPYAGIALTSPMQGIDISIPNDEKVRETAEAIEAKEDEIQEAATRQEASQEREDAARERAWLADCGNDGPSMYERAGRLSSISPASNPYYLSPGNWSFSVALSRAKAYYSARYNDEPGSSASGPPEEVAKSVARKAFYAYALGEVSRGYVETSDTGDELPHLTQLARNTSQIRETSLYTDAVYPISSDGNTGYLHAYSGCPQYGAESPMGYAAVCDIDSGSVRRCPVCSFDATTIGRVPSASTSINNGFEYHYLELVEASRDYAQAVIDGEEAKRVLHDARESIGNALSEAVSSLSEGRFDPQPPGRYGCVCIVTAPGSQLQTMPFVSDEAALPARIAISGATLAPDEASDQGNVISNVAEGLVSRESLIGAPVKTAFGAWASLLMAYSDGTEGIKRGFREVLGVIPVVGTSLSDSAISTFEAALGSAGLEPAELATYKPVLASSAQVLERDTGMAAQFLGDMRHAAQAYETIARGDVESLLGEVLDMPGMDELLDEHGITIAELPLGDLGLGTGNGRLYLPVPKDLKARVEDAISSFAGSLARR